MLSGTSTYNFENCCFGKMMAEDSVSSRLRADADFFNADFRLVIPFDELDTLGKGYQHYFESFSKASHLTKTLTTCLRK